MTDPTTDAPVVATEAVAAEATPDKPVSFEERLAKAKAEVAAETEAATAPPAAGAAPVVETKAEPPSRTARGLAEIAEREARLVDSQRELKTQLAQLETRGREFDSRAAEFHKAQALVKAGDHLGALAALGIDMEKAQDQYLDKVRAPTAEDAGRAAAREEFARLKAADAEAARSGADERLKTHEAALSQTRQKYEAETVAAFKANRAEFDFLEQYEVSSAHVLARAIEMERATGKTPEPIEVLRDLERVFDERASRTKKFVGRGAGDKKAEQAGDTAPSRTLTSRTTGDVPLTAKSTAKRLTVAERIAEAKREYGVT